MGGHETADLDTHRSPLRWVASTAGEAVLLSLVIGRIIVEVKGPHRSSAEATAEKIATSGLLARFGVDKPVLPPNGEQFLGSREPLEIPLEQL